MQILRKVRKFWRGSMTVRLLLLETLVTFVEPLVTCSIDLDKLVIMYSMTPQYKTVHLYSLPYVQIPCVLALDTLH